MACSFVTDDIFFFFFFFLVCYNFYENIRLDIACGSSARGNTFPDYYFHWMFAITFLVYVFVKTVHWMDVIEGDRRQHLREVSSFTYGQAHDKTYNKTCMTSKY